MEVADNGPGIEEDVMGRIFDPFFSTKEEGVGMGLGLSIAYAIAQGHGGVLEVTTRPEVDGTRAELILPPRDVGSDARVSFEAGA